MGELTNTKLITFLNNILIYKNTLKQLWERTFRCLDYLQANGLYVNLKKYQFEVTWVKFLNHILKPNKIRMDPDKIDSIL